MIADIAFKREYFYVPTMAEAYCILMMVKQKYIYDCGFIRLRGGGPGNYPSSDKNYNDIPYLTNIRFMWNGEPCLNFVERIM